MTNPDLGSGAGRPQRDFSAFAFRTLLSAELSRDDIEVIGRLFESNYREANQEYLLRSLTKLKCTTIATHDGVPAAFALGESRMLDLPRLPRTFVAMAGICCVSPQFRRRGLFAETERRSILAGDAHPDGRSLSCGRMAHPASFRLMMRNPAVVPKPGLAPSEWHRSVGIALAEAYGVADFDPRTFVCKGGGVPIGYPIMEVDASPEEWEMFRYVDRSRGDSLLGMAWMPDAPAGW